MNAVLITAVLAALKARILAGIESWKGSLPDALKPFADQAASFLGSLIDAIDIQALEADISGRLIELLKTGKGPSASSPVDLA